MLIEKTTNDENTEKTVKTATKVAEEIVTNNDTENVEKAEKAETSVNPNEKTFRVVFKKNNGLGKRTRVVMKAETIEALTEAIEAKAKADRMRPMRVQEMNGDIVVTKLRIKAIDGALDIVKAKTRKLATHVATDEKKIEKAKTEKVEETEKVEASAKDAGIEFDGIEFDVD
jgi:hypothetical protein